jgi:hypothetical protein
MGYKNTERPGYLSNSTAAMPKDCTVHLFSLKPGLYPGAGEVIAQVANQDKVEILLSGIPHGWIHKPHHQDVDRLLSHDWHLFLLTETETESSEAAAAAFTPSWPLPADAVTAHITARIAIPCDQYDRLEADVARERARDLRRNSDSDSDDASSELRSSSSHQLPSEWAEPGTPLRRIPENCIDRSNPSCQATTERPAPPGTLRLDPATAHFLSTALPDGPTQQGPVSLFNLFKYRNGDPAVHDKYMGDFKREFGDGAGGARVKFMGPLESHSEEKEEEGVGSLDGWQEANLTQYESIYHYAYMLSTDAYQRLNKHKVRGLEDTCILLVSEGEAWHENHFGSQTPLGYKTSWSEPGWDEDEDCDL